MNENEQWWSPVYYELLGYEDQEIEASVKSFRQLVHPQDRQKTFDLVQEHFVHHKPFEIEYHLKTKSGDYRWFSGSGQADFDEEGNPTRMVGTISDIEERKKLEGILYDTQEMANVGGWEYDLETGNVLWTDEVYRIHEALIGTDIDIEVAVNFYAAEARPVLEKAIKKSIETGESWDLELPIITAKDNNKWVRTIGKVHYKDGEACKLSGTFQDLTARKKIENELLDAKEKADAANQAKSQFIANMSHEIRTPMNAILGFAELLKGQIKGEEEKNYVENIHSSGKNLLSLINDILDLSKIEAGKQEIQLQPVNLVRLAAEIKDIFSIKARQKGIDIKTDVADNVPESLLLDEVRIRQVLLNLAGNSVKFTHKGFVKISVGAEHREKNESMVDLTISIQDTGIGIQKNKQEIIFQEFEQENFTILEQYGGTGLGLSISQKLIGMMNGEITIDSASGKGSTFHVFIPEVTIASVVEKSGIEPVDWSENYLKPSKILIVDDLSINRELVAEYLKGQPLELLEAGNGRDAIEIVQKEAPDLVLMDIKMPGMSGIEAMQTIKKEHSTTVVALTASGFKGLSKSSKEIGFDAYMRKPVTKQQLIQELAKFLGFREETESQMGKAEKVVVGTKFDWDIEEMETHELEEILRVITEKIVPAYKKVDRDAMIMSQYKPFINLLKQAGTSYNNKVLLESASTILSAVERFDIEQIEDELNEFQTVIDDLIDKISTELTNRNS